jgi:putative membrane protein
MMKRAFCITLALVTLLVIQACNNKKAKNYNNINLANEEGISFVKDAIESGEAGIKASQLALTNSKNPEVLAFAKMIINDHTDADVELKKIAGSKIINDTLTVAHEHLISSLAAKKGRDFDKEYMQAMVNDHENAIKVFKTGETNTDEKLKDFADKTLPKVQEHLKQANEICLGLK